MTLPAVQELRALDVFDRIPAGLETMAVQCGRNWPHLCPGELAVFDPSQRQPIHGELFVFRYSNGHQSISGTEYLPGWLGLPDDGNQWWTCPLNRPLGGETVDDWLREGRQLYLSDGPSSAEVIGRNIIGRVVGVYMGQEARSWPA